MHLGALEHLGSAIGELERAGITGAKLEVVVP